jgi:cytochrome P450
MLTQALNRESIEIVNEFALPVQSRALTYLLNTSESEADTWIGWGIHVFKVTGGEFKKGTVLEDYLHQKFDEAEANPGEDFFSALVKAEYRGRKLTREECMGFANLAFAGGRDTIIHTISCALGYLAEHPEALEYLRADPKRITLASEEFFRVFMPLTHIGRVCPADTDVNGVTVKAGERISLAGLRPTLTKPPSRIPMRSASTANRTRISASASARISASVLLMHASSCARC